MSDRYETPRWDDEPDDLATRTPVADEGYEPGGAGAEVEEPGLEASSENVLDGWPAVDPDAVPEDEEESPVEEVPAAQATPAAEASPAAEAARPPRSQPRTATTRPKTRFHSPITSPIRSSMRPAS